MTMLEQARHRSFGLTKTFFSRSSKSAFSRHDNVRASSTLSIWLSENVRIVCLCKREQRPKRKETTPKQGRTTFKQERATYKQGGNNRTTERERYSRMNEQPHKRAVTSPKVEGTLHKQEGTTYKQGERPINKKEQPASKRELPHKQGGTTAQANGKCFLRKGKRHAHATSAYKCKLWPIRSCLVLRYL